MVLKIGLTGGIASGKSIAANYFADLQVPIIDADLVARDLLMPSFSYYHQVIAYFGAEIICADQSINRSKMREIIFADQNKRTWLENLLHPKIRKIMQKKASEVVFPYSILVIPLLFETKFPFQLDRILLIDSPISLQYARLLKRDHITYKQAHAIVNSQAQREWRQQHANDIINNNSNLTSLKKAVKNLHHQYLMLAKSITRR